MFVQAHPSALTITDHDGLVWTLRLVDPDWPRMLRRLVRDIAAVDRRHAEARPSHTTPIEPPTTPSQMTLPIEQPARRTIRFRLRRTK